MSKEPLILLVIPYFYPVQQNKIMLLGQTHSALKLNLVPKRFH